MKLARLVTLAFLVSLGAPLAIAQDSIRLQFEIVKDAATVARPEVSVTAGSDGTIEVASVGSFTVTPTLRGSDSLAIAFHVRSGGKDFRPGLVIGRDQPGILSWASADGAHAFELTVSWLR